MFSRYDQLLRSVLLARDTRGGPIQEIAQTLRALVMGIAGDGLLRMSFELENLAAMGRGDAARQRLLTQLELLIKSLFIGARDAGLEVPDVDALTVFFHAAIFGWFIWRRDLVTAIPPERFVATIEYVLSGLLPPR